MSYKLWKSINEKKLDESLAFNLGVKSPQAFNAFAPASEEITEEDLAEAKKTVDKMKKMHYMKKMAGTMKEGEDIEDYTDDELLEAVLLEMKKKKKKKMDGEMGDEEEPAPKDAEKPEEEEEEEEEEDEDEEEEEEEEEPSDDSMTCAHCGKNMKKKMKKKMKKESVVDVLAKWALDARKKNSDGWSEYTK